ncbi:MAG: hypothetical protein E7546_01890 [Ruminococcaceae bacterium]|nr:hypothetical protein [Oscillospiraceae bacterium]
MKRQSNKKHVIGCFAIALLVLIALTAMLYKNSPESSNVNTNPIIASFAKQHNIQTSAWPEELIALLEKNPETQDFVLNYPIKKGTFSTANLDEYKNSDSVPLLLQWDERWGYFEYAGELMGLSGCGPVCLSMVCIHLLNDTSLTPLYIAQFSEANGYSLDGNGSSWTLISVGGKQLGLDVVEIPLDENRIIRNLEVGNPIICVMGPGDFTSTGHFIVMTGYIDGKVRINDPNSTIRSEKLWELSDITDQIRNLWVCRV